VASSLADFSIRGARGETASLAGFLVKRFFIWSKNFIVTPLVATTSALFGHATDIRPLMFHIAPHDLYTPGCPAIIYGQRFHSDVAT
jgi:hypothetical protein